MEPAHILLVEAGCAGGGETENAGGRLGDAVQDERRMIAGGTTEDLFGHV